jgi:sulfur transfer protein SufE
MEADMALLVEFEDVDNEPLVVNCDNVLWMAPAKDRDEPRTEMFFSDGISITVRGSIHTIVSAIEDEKRESAKRMAG